MRKVLIFLITLVLAVITAGLFELLAHPGIEKVALLFIFAFICWYMLVYIVADIVADYHKVNDDRSFPRPGGWDKRLE